MIRIDGYFFYQVGAAIRPLTVINENTTKADVRGLLYGAQAWLQAVLGQDLFRLKTSLPKGNELLTVIKNLVSKFDALTADKLGEEIGWWESYSLRTNAEEFQTLLSAELRFADLYLVTRKGGFDTTDLAERGECTFPEDLTKKVPEALPDARQAARCIAFELPTAAGFHLHRVNESVLRKYYDVVTNGKPRPENRSIGAYIKALRDNKAGDAKVIAALESLKDLHRNPIIHPEESLGSVEEALALHGAIQSVMVHMLKVIVPMPAELPTQGVPA
jgi:hypothetical protein